MSEVREIVTRAVLAKGKKIFRIHENENPGNEAYSVLGCWVINHEFEATLSGKKVDLDGNFEINIWYAYDNNSKTDIARAFTKYNGTIKVREIICDSISDHCDVVARILQQPTCTNARITENGIEIEVVFEVCVEVIGETKMMVTVFQCNDTCCCDTIDDDFENEINEDFINENEIVG